MSECGYFRVTQLGHAHCEDLWVGCFACDIEACYGQCQQVGFIVDLFTSCEGTKLSWRALSRLAWLLKLQRCRYWVIELLVEGKVLGRCRGEDVGVNDIAEFRGNG